MREQELDVSRRLGLCCGDARAHRGGCLGPNGGGEVVVEDARAPEIPLEAADALALLLLFYALQIDVRAGIVGGRMWGGPVGDGLDEGRTVACARPRHGLGSPR